MQRVVQENLNQDDAVEIWRRLDQACTQISIKQVKSLSYQDLYNYAYKLILNKFGPFVYENLAKTIKRIFDQLAAQILQYNDNLLNDFVRLYEDCQLFTKMVSDIFLYMEKNYILPKSLKTIRSLSNDIFRISVFEKDPQLASAILSCLLHTIRQDRDGQPISKIKLKQALLILVDLNVRQHIKIQNQYSSTVEYEGNEDFYRSFFERKLINETIKYYKEETLQMLQIMSIQEFVGKLEIRYLQEEERTRQYLPKSSQNKIIDCFIKNCINTNVQFICNGLYQFIENDQINLIQRIYKLMVKHDDSMNAFIRMFVLHVKDKGNEYQKIQNDQTLPGLMYLYQKIFKMLETISMGNSEQNYQISQAITNQFLQLINQDQFILNELNKYFDILMKKEQSEETRIAIENGFTIFKLIQAKDQFEVVYRKLLCLRLLDQSYTSLEQEKSMIFKIKVECGANLTSRMEIMFNDLHRSTSESLEFKKKFDAIDFEIQVLSGGQWPLSDSIPMQLHEDLANWKGLFETNYLTRNPKRKLEWNYGLGFVSLRAYFGRDVKKEFICSVGQAAILLHFNTLKSRKLSELQTLTNLTPDHLQQELETLLHHKLLINEDQVYTLNMKYNHRSYKIKIQVKKINALLSSKKKPEETIDKEVIIDRKIYLESLIVRVLKTRKQLEHKTLYYEVEKDSKNRPFGLDQILFKECIANLISREYLIRQEGTIDTYIYRA